MDKMQTVIMNYKKSKIVKKKKKNKKKIISTYPDIPLTNSKKKTKKIFEFRKIKRQKDMIMTDKVRKGNIEFTQEFDKKFNIYQEKSKRKSSLIQQQLKKQSNIIVDKLKQRRDRSISKSKNSSIFGKKKVYGKSQIRQKNIYSEKKNIDGFQNKNFGNCQKNFRDLQSQSFKELKKKNFMSDKNFGEDVLDSIDFVRDDQIESFDEKGGITIEKNLQDDFDSSFEKKKIKSGLI